MACNSFHAALSVATLASSADFMAWSCVPPWVTSWADCNCQGDNCKAFWRFCHVILSFFIFLFSSKIRTGQKIHWCQPPQVPRSYQYQQQKTPVSMTLRHACLGVHVRMVFFLQFCCANSSLHLGGSSEASWKISFTLKKSTSVRDDQVFETTYRTSKHPHSFSKMRSQVGFTTLRSWSCVLINGYCRSCFWVQLRELLFLQNIFSVFPIHEMFVVAW